MDSNIYVYINGTKTSLMSLAASSGISYATILARYKAGVAPDALTAGAKAVLDTVPTAGSANGITSGAAFTAFAGKIGTVSGATAGSLARLKSDGTLEDSGISYEAGTWTPVIMADSAPMTVTYSARIGNYIRIGKQVHLQMSVVASAITTVASGSFNFSGIPFTPLSPAGYAIGSVIMVGLNRSALVTSNLFCRITSTAVAIQQRYDTVIDVDNVPASSLQSNGGYFFLTVDYICA